MAADPLVGKVLADRFEILERIGEGGTGVVYKARQITVDKTVAIKVLGAHVSTDPLWVKRFHNEARAAAKLDHPHTVRIFDFGQTKEGLCFIAMELLQGRSLRQEISKLGRLPVPRALRIVAQAAHSVHEAHLLGIIHRDIKPDNLYLIDHRSGSDYVKVLDFSVAKLDDPESIKTRVGVVLGTPEYMSPEQGQGKPLGPQSDIYAFGVVLHECLSGKPPFVSKIPTEVVIMQVRDRPPPLEGVPEVVSRLVMKALEKDPTRRQQSAEQLAEECEAALVELGISLTPVTGHRAISVPPVTPPPMAAVAVRTPSPPMATVDPGAGALQGAGRETRTPPGSAPAPPQAATTGRSPTIPGPGMSASAAASAPVPQAAADMRTVAGSPSPVSMAPGAGAALPGSTGALAMPPQGTMSPGGTMVLTDSSGIVALAAAQAQVAQAQAASAEPAPKPAGMLFWSAWVVLGFGLGLGFHLLRIAQQSGAS